MLASARRFDWTFLACSAFACVNFFSFAPITTAGAHQTAQVAAQDPKASSEAADFDAFLDAHPDIDAQLRTNPLLINDAKWLRDHPQLLSYFDQHPQAKSEIAESPSYFIRREGQRASREDRERNENLRKEEITNFHQFLNSNPQISEQLRADPGLIKESKYLDAHPGLQAYLYDHPQVNKDLLENPDRFLQRASHPNTPPPNNASKNGTEVQIKQGQVKQTNSEPPANVAKREQAAQKQQRSTGGAEVKAPTEQAAQRPSPAHSSPPNSEIDSFDRFLDRHPDISQQLSSNPSLIANTQYLEQHPGLRALLDDHPNVKQHVTQTPDYFAQREVQTSYDTLEARRPPQPSTVQPQPAASPASQRQSVTSISVLTTSEIASFDQFLGDHKKINDDLEKEPTRVNDAGYLKKNKDLQNYLHQHPAVRDELTRYPAYFMNRRNRYELGAAERTIETRSSTSANSASAITTLSQKDLRATDRFLEKHKNIYRDLVKNPSLATDTHYLKKQKDFRQFLEQNPDVNTALKEDPVRFMQNQHDRFEQMREKM